MFATTQLLVDRYVRERAFDGAAVIAMQRGKFLLEHYSGEAAPELPSSSDVLWPLASISKLYSVTAIMRLIERGVLTVNTTVRQVLPHFDAPHFEKMRLRHLLTHTSGLPYESSEMTARLAAQTPLNALIDELRLAEPMFAAGSRHSYADYNTLLAAHMAETATGTPFDALVRTLVLEPARLFDTHFPPAPKLHARIAKVRGVLAEGTDGAMYNSAYALGLAHPAFGVVATATDLARFGHLFTSSGARLVSNATVRAMTSDQAGFAVGEHVALKGLPADAVIPFGFGFMLQTPRVPALISELASMRAFGHGGASGCWLAIDPEIDLIVAVVSNAHVNLGRDAWSRRLQSIVNTVFAAVTQ
jgi:CubicO group peptidase (beta-lactamase class C family)